VKVDISGIDLLADGRATWEDTFTAMATVLAQLRGDCTRRKVGAIIYDHRNGDFIEAGYNGAAHGAVGCLEGGCPRGRHFQNPGKSVCNHNDFDSLFCQCGARWPCDKAVPPGSSYDTGPGACIAIHAEANAQIRAGTRSRGMTMAVNEEPCLG
jgi:dCMP deaminase